MLDKVLRKVDKVFKKVNNELLPSLSIVTIIDGYNRDLVYTGVSYYVITVVRLGGHIYNASSG